METDAEKVQYLSNEVGRLTAELNAVDTEHYMAEVSRMRDENRWLKKIIENMTTPKGNAYE